MTLFFHPAFCTSYFGPNFFKVQDPKKLSGRPDILHTRVQIDWSTVNTVVLGQIYWAILTFIPLQNLGHCEER